MPNETTEVKEPSRWFAEVPGDRLRKSKPQTKEGVKWVLEYIAKYDRAPSIEEFNAWKSGISPEEMMGWTYTPESTMGQMGWGDLTRREYIAGQRYGANFGPYAGRLVPEESVVLTDQYGNPLFRTTSLAGDVTGGFVQRGQYIEPPGGFGTRLTEQMRGRVTPGEGYAPEDVYQYYNRPLGEQPRWQAPTLEEMMATPSTDIYQAQLKDYLLEQVRGDYGVVQEIMDRRQDLESNYKAEATDLESEIRKAELNYNSELRVLEDSYTQGMIDENTFNKQKYNLNRDYGVTSDNFTRQLSELNNKYEFLWNASEQELSNLMTEERATQVLSEAEGKIGLGMGGEGLPYFADVQGVRSGQNLMNLYNAFVSGKKDVWETQYNEWEKQRRIRQFGGEEPYAGETASLVTGNEFNDYADYIKSLEISQIFENQMLNSYGEYYRTWISSGTKDNFIDWLIKYIVGEF